LIYQNNCNKGQQRDHEQKEKRFRKVHQSQPSFLSMFSSLMSVMKNAENLNHKATYTNILIFKDTRDTCDRMIFERTLSRDISLPKEWYAIFLFVSNKNLT
jgi:hypothetical protein